MMTVVDIHEWVRVEQDLLWDQLASALRSAINGVWSIEAANVACRIVGAARLVGPTDPDSVPWTLVGGGVYHDLLDLAAIDYDNPQPEQWDRWDQQMASRSGPRTDIREQFAATREAMRNDGSFILANA